MKTIKSIFIITLLIILSLFTVSCSNSIKEDAHKKQRGSGSVSFNIQIPGQNKIKARMITPSDDAVMKKLNSLSYDVELSFREDDENYNTEVTKHYTSLEDFLSEASDMTLKYGDWKLSITGQEGQNGAEIVNAEEDFTVTDGDNLVTIRFKFSNELAGSLKYTFIVDGLTDLAATVYEFYFYSGNTADEENRVDIDASTNAFYTNTWEELADGIFGGVGCKLNSLEINNLAPGEYLLRITETSNGSDSGYSEQPVYIYGGIESTGCYTSLGNLLLLNYDQTNERNVHIYHKDLATAALPKIKKIMDGKADLTIADSGANKKLIVPYKKGNMFAGWYFDKDAYYTPGTNEPDLAPYSPVFEAKDEDGFIVKKDFELNAVWKQAIDVIPSEEVNNKIYVQTASTESTIDGYITAKSLNELPDFLEPYNTSMGQVNSGYSEVSAFCDYVTNTTSDGDFIYFVENEYSDYNLKLRWHSLPAENLYTGTSDIDGYWEDDTNQKDLSDMFTDEEDFQEYDKKVFEKLYRQGNNLYIIGKCYKSNSNSDPYYFCLVKCELDETTHTPDIGSFEMFRKEIDDTIYEIQSFAVSDSNLLVAYRDVMDAEDIKIASYELNEAGDFTSTMPIVKNCSDFYTMTDAGPDYSNFHTVTDITDIYYYNEYFYVCINECSVASDSEADTGSTLISTGTILKLDSSLGVVPFYSLNLPEIERLDTEITENIYVNTKCAASPADMSHFMGPNRILGTSEDGSKLFISDDGLYIYKMDSSYKAKWAHRIIIYNVIEGKIEYYIPVNLPYRGGSRTLLGSVYITYEQ